MGAKEQNDQFCSDITGQSCLRSKQIGEGAILTRLLQEQVEYVHKAGGYDAIREADCSYNDLNRKQLAAFYRYHGHAFLGRHAYDKQDEIARGEFPVYVEYTGQYVPNFAYSFVVPIMDEELERRVRAFNGQKGNLYTLVCRITERIEELGGLLFYWY